MSLMSEAIYKSSYVMLSKSDRDLVGVGDVPLVSLGCAVLNRTLAETVIKEQVYIVRGASKLLLGVAAIRSLDLIHEIPGTYSVKAVNQMPDNHPLRSGTKEGIVKQYPMLFEGLGKLEGEHALHLKEAATPFFLTTPRRVPLPLMKKVQEEIKRMEQLGTSRQNGVSDCGGAKGQRKGTDVLTLQVLTKQSGEKSIKCQHLTRHWEVSKKDRYSPNSMLT